MLGQLHYQVHPTGEVDLALPASLTGLANQPHRRYRLSCPARFRHRAAEWSAQIAVGAVAYAIWFSPEVGRWYLDASWTSTPRPPIPWSRLWETGS
jgi:hypothetical protein